MGTQPPAHNWADWTATQRSYELIARYVHPHFRRNTNALRDASYGDATAKRATAGMEMQKAVQTAIDKYQAGRGSPQAPKLSMRKRASWLTWEMVVFIRPPRAGRVKDHFKKL